MINAANPFKKTRFSTAIHSIVIINLVKTVYLFWVLCIFCAKFTLMIPLSIIFVLSTNHKRVCVESVK